MKQKSLITTVTAALVLSMGLSACNTAKKKQAEDSAHAQAADSQLGGIESRALAVDAQGSDSGKIAGLQSINFEYDSDKLTPIAREKLQGNAQWMKSNSNMSLVIEGHCDERGSNEYNLALGERRANSVKRYLVSMGVVADRLRTISYGEERPLVSGDTDEALARNRRANFVPNETTPMNRSAVR